MPGGKIMSYVLEELRGLDTILSDLKKRIEALERTNNEMVEEINILKEEINSIRKMVPRKLASERQKKLIADICKTLNIPLPEGFYSNLTKEEASQFISEKLPFFYDAKRKEGVRATA
jgi:regulator of replication initiation timing